MAFFLLDEEEGDHLEGGVATLDTSKGMGMFPMHPRSARPHITKGGYFTHQTTQVLGAWDSWRCS